MDDNNGIKLFSVSVIIALFLNIIFTSGVVLSSRQVAIENQRISVETYNMLLEKDAQLNRISDQLNMIESRSTTLALEFNQLTDAIHYEWVGIVNTREKAND